MKVRDRLGISEKVQSHLTRGMQLLLIGIMFFGFYIGSAKVVVNSAIGVIVTFLPGIMEKRYDITLDTALALWITSAVFLHAIGSVNLVGPGSNLYTSIPWWDHMTHALSASVVTAAGYITLRSLDEHYDELQFPRKLLFVFILMFILAFGVFWELIEFAISGISQVLGMDTVLTQYGLEDSMKDLVFNTAGGMIVAAFGEIYLSGTIKEFTGFIERKTKDIR